MLSNQLRIFWMIALSCFTCTVYAQTQQWAVSSIPDSLKKNAKSVLRYENTNIELGAIGKAVIKYSKVITVLSEEAEDELLFTEYEDNFRKLKEADIYVWNANGEQQEHYKKKQLEKVLGNDGVSFVSNYKVYSFKVPASQYPITVQFEYEVALKGYIDFEDFWLARPDQTIQEATYTISTTIENPIRYKSYLSNIQPEIIKNGNAVLYKWQIKNVAVLKYERRASKNNFVPKVLITPTQFEMDDYRGSFADWKEFGKWYYSMCDGTFDLSNSQIEEIKTAIGNATNTKEKVAILYRYMQNNCRYVGIQLGIGGFKPFKSSFVHKNKYGDCKALTTYMQSILKIAEIESYQALINAGSRLAPVDPLFANNQFNHVILCVPNNGDSIWLECTSKDNESGKLGSFTENRNALIIKADGGYLVPTPKSKAQNNLQQVKTIVQINDDLSADVTMKIESTGEFKEMFINNVKEADEDERKSFLIRDFGLKPFENLEIANGNENKNATQLQIEYAKIHDFNAGSKFFLRQHLFEIWQSVLPTDLIRTSDYYFNFPFLENDTTIYQMPPHFTIDNIPGAIDLNSQYATYIKKIEHNKEMNTLTVITQLQLITDKIPAKNFLETKIFFDKVITDSNQKLVIKKM